MEKHGPADGGRPLVRLLRPGRADPEGPRHPALGLGGDRRPQDDAATARPVLVPNPQFAARGWRTYVWNNVPGLGRRGPRLPARERRLRGRALPRDQPLLRPRLEPEPRGARPRLGRLRGPAQALPVRAVRLLPERCASTAAASPLDPQLFVGKERLTDYGRDHIVGIQGNLWSETLGGEGRLERALLPKLFGLAERAWAPDPAWAVETDAAKSEALYREAWSRVRERRREARAAASRAGGHSRTGSRRRA